MSAAPPCCQHCTQEHPSRADLLYHHLHNLCRVEGCSAQDGLMSCPCGRGDYDLCNGCPYRWCSVHGDGGDGRG